MVGVGIFLICAFAWTGESAEYYTFFLEDICTTSEAVTVTVGSNGANSSGILSASRNRTFLHHRNCTVCVQPSIGHGIVLTVRYLDMRPAQSTNCENYVLVTGEEQNGEFYLCGYSDDVTEYKSYYTTGPMKIQFHTVSPKVESHSDISLIVTSFLKRKTECPLEMFQCENDRCVWEGLTCDNHNNCGDRSDENKFSRSHCGGYWSIVGISLGAVVAFSLFVAFPIVLWYRRRSRRLDEVEEEEERRRLLPGDGSIQQERSRLPPYNETPPPTYDEAERQGR